ncbi:glycosyltransferase [Agrobacterium rosae]|uniref:glycosyltransferase n=1 Tax=Agrobacterium rosae TaxID=1972867 RepID=UPI002A11A53F|nr:glycosyltransferase [Agrobacterium rosae]MDX8315972.1 glycosyltransferase [Agrobacterium rosae]
MMKILFVDHSYHKITTSSQFLIDLLRRFFAVDVFYADPAYPHDIATLATKTDHDAVVLWQMDYLAPFFLARGFPTIVVPMYDGSGTMPDLHWLWARKAHFINFSRRLHERVKGLGGASLLVKYYPKADKRTLPTDWYDDVRVFLWQRRPEHGINLQSIERMFGSALSAVHLHDAPDDKNVDVSAYLDSIDKPYKLTTSKWFASRKDYNEVLAKFNFFIAPRRSEGIGMAFLEAMARGMIVCGHDDATHDEYISNGLNGILFNADLAQKVDVQDSRYRYRLSAMALKSVEDGHSTWLDTTLKIVDYIKCLPALKSTVPEVGSEAFLNGLISAYYSGIPVYQSYLARNLHLGSTLCGFQLENVLDESLKYDESFKSRTRRDLLRDASQKLPWLHRNMLRSHEIASDFFNVEGSAHLRNDAAWIKGEKLVLGFRVDNRMSATRKLVLKLRRLSVDPIRYCIILNGILLEASILTDQRSLELTIPESAVSVDNEIHLQFEGGDAIAGENVGIESLVLE